MTHTQLQNYTDKECFEYFKERYPNGHYRDELHLQIKQIIGYSKMKRKTAANSLTDLLNLVNSTSNKIYLLAAYYLIRTKNTMKPRNISIVNSEIYDYNQKLANNEINKSCPIDKAITHEAIVKQIYKLKDELEAIYARQKVDPNIEVTATIISSNGPEIQY